MPLTTGTPLTAIGLDLGMNLGMNLGNNLGMNVLLYLLFAKQRYDSTQFNCRDKPFDLKTFEQDLCKLLLLLAEKEHG
jgi:hypothetical protein